MGLLDGKVAVVTGAGGGIGRAEALLLAKEGAMVVVNDIGATTRDGAGESASVAEAVVAEITAAGGRAAASTSPVHTQEGADAIVKTAVDAFGRVDVWINNAGILRDKTLGKTTLEDFRAVLDVHLTGSFLCTQAAARQMLKQGEGGKIIQTTSISGMLGNFGQSNYAAAKAGIYGLMRTAAIELQKHRIYVNAIAPIAKTRMTEDLPMFQSVDTMTPEHVAPLALYLASELSGTKTGHVLAVAGSQMYAFKVVQTKGRFKDGSDPWTAEEIAEHFDAIIKG